jgi:hypothetical protein
MEKNRRPRKVAGIASGTQRRPDSLVFFRSKELLFGKLRSPATFGLLCISNMEKGDLNMHGCYRDELIVAIRELLPGPFFLGFGCEGTRIGHLNG